MLSCEREPAPNGARALSSDYSFLPNSNIASAPAGIKASGETWLGVAMLTDFLCRRSQVGIDYKLRAGQMVHGLGDASRGDEGWGCPKPS